MSRGKEPQRGPSGRNLNGSTDDHLYTSVIDGLKHLYRTKMRPLEEAYKYAIVILTLYVLVITSLYKIKVIK